MVLLRDIEVGQFTLNVLPSVLAQVHENVVVLVHTPYRLTDSNVSQTSLYSHPFASWMCNELLVAWI